LGIVGQFDHTNGHLNVDTNDQFYLFDTTPTFSGGAFVNATQYNSYPAPNGNTAVLKAMLSSEQDLINEDYQFYLYIKGLISSLPIELAEFKATIVNGEPHLVWKTLTEKNNEYFTIHRSFNGLDYDVITTINGAGSSMEEKMYSYTDHDLLSGPVYYQLSQTDYDGTTEFFNVVYTNLKWYYVKGFKINDSETLISVNQYDLSGHLVEDNYKGIKILVIITNKQKYSYKIIEK
jgi:hypothetical protein